MTPPGSLSRGGRVRGTLTDAVTHTSLPVRRPSTPDPVGEDQHGPLVFTAYQQAYHTQ